MMSDLTKKTKANAVMSIYINPMRPTCWLDKPIFKPFIKPIRGGVRNLSAVKVFRCNIFQNIVVIGLTSRYFIKLSDQKCC